MAPPKTCPKLKLADGNEIPVVGLGTWKAPPGEVYDAVCLAIDLGYRHLDCALVYENEAEIGRAINDKIAQGVVARSDLFITSKIWNTYRSTPERIAEGLNKTLTDLGVDYVDLYLVHWPFSWKEDGGLFPQDDKGKFIATDVDFMDVWKTLEQLQTTGKFRSLGVSNFNAEQVARVVAEGTVKPVMNQVECHPYLQQEKLRHFCEERNIKLTSYSCVGSPYRPMTFDAPPLLENPTVVEIAKAIGKSPAQVVLRFTVQRGIVVIPKSTNPGRLEANMQLFDFELSADQMEQLGKLDCAGRLVTMESMRGHKFYPFDADF